MEHNNTECYVENKFSFEIPRTWKWVPKTNITAYELALCVPVFVAGQLDYSTVIEGLPQCARRHFEELVE